MSMAVVVGNFKSITTLGIQRLFQCAFESEIRSKREPRSGEFRTRHTWPKSPCDRRHRHAVHDHDRLCAWVALGQAGIGGVVYGDTKAALVENPVGNLGAGAEPDQGPEVGAAAAGEVTGSPVRGQHPVWAEIYAHAEAEIAVEGAVAGAGHADERRDRPDY